MLDAIGVDDEELEHVEIRESIKPLLGPARPAREADPAAAVLQEHDPVADRRGDRGLADARLPAADPHPGPAARVLRRGRYDGGSQADPVASARRRGRAPRREAGCSRPRARPPRRRSARRPARWSAPPRKLQAIAPGSAGRARSGRGPRLRRVSAQAKQTSRPRRRRRRTPSWSAPSRRGGPGSRTARRPRAPPTSSPSTAASRAATAVEPARRDGEGRSRDAMLRDCVVGSVRAWSQGVHAG